MTAYLTASEPSWHRDKQAMLKKKKKKSSELYATIAVVSPGGCHEEAHLSDFTAAFSFCRHSTKYSLVEYEKTGFKHRLLLRMGFIDQVCWFIIKTFGLSGVSNRLFVWSTVQNPKILKILLNTGIKENK